MKLNRRSFLGAAAASPMAARQALAGQAAGVASVGHAAMNVPMPEAHYERAIAKAFLATGLPDWKRDELWRAATYAARVLDPDIAAMHSLSLASKMRIQRGRHYQRAVENITKSSVLAEAREAFFKKVLSQ